MFTRILTAISVSAALIIPMNAANAGFLKNVAKIGVADAKAQAFFLKKDGLSGKFVKDSLKVDGRVAKALFKAAF
jgi:hypothetical protein